MPENRVNWQSGCFWSDDGLTTANDGEAKSMASIIICTIKSTKNMRTNHACMCVCVCWMLCANRKQASTVWWRLASSVSLVLFVYCYISIGELLHIYTYIFWFSCHHQNGRRRRRCHCHWSGSTRRCKQNELVYTDAHRHASKQNYNERWEEQKEEEKKMAKPKSNNNHRRLEMPNEIFTILSTKFENNNNRRNG